MLLLLPAGQRSQMLQRRTMRGPCWCGSLRVVLPHEEGPWQREGRTPMVPQHQPETRRAVLGWAGDTGKLGWISGGGEGSWGTEERGWGEWCGGGEKWQLRVTGQGLLPLSRNDDEGPRLRLHSCIDLLQKPKSPWGGRAEGARPLKKTKDEEKTFTFTVLADVIIAEQLPTCLTNPEANINKRVNIYILNMRKIAVAKLKWLN